MSDYSTLLSPGTLLLFFASYWITNYTMDNMNCLYYNYPRLGHLPVWGNDIVPPLTSFNSFNSISSTGLHYTRERLFNTRRQRPRDDLTTRSIIYDIFSAGLLRYR